jgi:predicted transcriptional regulator
MADAYLSPREQQVMEIVYRNPEGVAVADVLAALPGDPSNSAVRTHLRILEAKGHLCHVEEDGRYIYRPTRPRQTAARSALSRVLSTFFDNSVERVMATLLSEKEGQLTDDELDRLRQMIDAAREKGR